jgi:ketosteroid isomerase-like protein
MSKEDDLRQVRNVIARFSQAFAKTDVAGVREVWDEVYENPVYQPEECLEPLLTQEAVRTYFESLPSVIRGVSDVRTIDFRVDVLDDTAHAFTRAVASLHLCDRADPLVGEVRQSFVLRRRDGKWLLIHHHESRLTPGFA